MHKLKTIWCFSVQFDIYCPTIILHHLSAGCKNSSTSFFSVKVCHVFAFIARAKRELYHRTHSVHLLLKVALRRTSSVEVWKFTKQYGHKCSHIVSTIFWQCATCRFVLLFIPHRDAVHSVTFGGNCQFFSKVSKITFRGIFVKKEKRHFLQIFDQCLL